MKNNYKYGKLVNGALKYATYPIKINGYDVYGATEEQYFLQGYKKVLIDSRGISEDEELEIVFTQTENEIKVEYVKSKDMGK